MRRILHKLDCRIPVEDGFSKYITPMVKIHATNFLMNMVLIGIIYL